MKSLEGPSALVRVSDGPTVIVGSGCTTVCTQHIVLINGERIFELNIHLHTIVTFLEKYSDTSGIYQKASVEPMWFRHSMSVRDLDRWTATVF